MNGVLSWLLFWRRPARGGVPAGLAGLPIQPGRPPEPAPLAEAPRRRRRGVFRELMHRADSLINALSGLGTEDDKGTNTRPDTSRSPLSWQENLCLFRFNGYASRYAEIIPFDATRKGWRVKDSSADTAPLEEETKRLRIPARICEANVWARFGGGAVIYLVVDEEIPPEFADNPSRLLERPIDPRRLLRVRNLIPLDRSEATPVEWESDPRSPRFREARIWMLSPNAQGLGDLASGQRVHASRILYFPGRRLPPALKMTNGGYDDSIFEAAWEAIRNRGAVDAAGASLAQEIKISVLKVANLQALQTSDQADLIEMRMRMLARTKSVANTAIMGDGEEYTSNQTPFTGFDLLSEVTKEALSAVTGMPAPIWFGEAPGGLNADGESHRDLWAKVIEAWQEDRLLSPLLYLYLLLFLAREGPTAGVVPTSWTIEFEPLDALTALGTAQLRKVHAETDAILIGAGIIPPEHVAKSRLSDKGYQNELLPYDPDAAVNATVAEVQALLQQRRAMAPGAAPPTASPTPTPTPTPGATP